MATNKPGCVQQQNVLDLDTLSLPSVCQSCNLTKLACLCPIICDRDSNDPDKIWAILHYPDALKISHNMLCCLLKKLRNYQDDKVCLSQFEWTLAARVNCADDDPTKGVQISSKTPPPCTDCSCKDLATGASNGKLESGGTSATVNGYFCVTAPVKAFEIEGKKLDPKNPHYVSDYTHTIIVDLRYSFRQRINVPECTPQVYSICYLDNIANKVQELVTCHLEIAKDTKFRVYVLKPQNQTYCGVSPISTPPRIEDD